MRKIGFLCIQLIYILLSHVQGQNIYSMQNYRVYDCKGIFTDSDLGIIKGDYAHNERLIFSVCVPGGDYVSLEFDSFCTEKDVDFLQFYDGRDTFAAKIGGRHHGTKSPGVIKSSDSCLTIYFQSDASVACFGWKAKWRTKILPLPSPKFIRNPVVSCSTSVLRIRLDQKFICDSIHDSTFTLSGSFAPAISKVTPIGCVNGETDSFEITLSSGLNRGGSYALRFRSVKYDRCDSAWNLEANTTFSITDCPINVTLRAAPDTICERGCTNIFADVNGGDSTKYAYSWNQGLGSAKPPVKVCPMITTTYILTVSDGVAIPGSDTITIAVKPKPAAPQDTSVCQSGGAFVLSGAPTGGTWNGKGITNASTGDYLPASAGAGRDTVRYILNGCADTMIVDVRAISGGLPNAACPGTAPFYVSGHSPAGGTWSGPKINAAGLFNPDSAGSYVVTYTWNGCTANKIIRVDSIKVPDADTICLSAGNITLSFSPQGGTWSGTGIINNNLGIFNTNTAGIGTKNLIYTMRGCRDTLKMTVENINARGNQVICLSQPSFTMLPGIPAGGYWKGKGVADSALGVYNPALVGKVTNDTIEYIYGGCSAKKIMYLRNVYVYLKNKNFCIENPQILLDFNSVQVTPFGGVWNGSGISSLYYFTPSLAGYGSHKLIYDFNGCLDSTTFLVYPKSDIQKDTSFCVADPSFKLRNAESGGKFLGNGITDSLNGIFNPGRAGVGVHMIRYLSKNGCKDSVRITVTGLPIVQLSGAAGVHCFRDTLISLTGSPAGGNFWGNGVNTNQFNPFLAGSGNHTLYYRYGTSTCYRIDSIVATVMPVLKVKALSSDDTLCKGGSVELDAKGSGGNSSNYSFRWSTGQTGNSLFYTPSITGYQKVWLNDGCSNEATDSVYIVVHPTVTAAILTSAIKCYGEKGFAEVTPGTSDPFEVTWNTAPPFKGYRLTAFVSNRYTLNIKNLATGCLLDTFTTIPGYPKIKASFITIPRTGICLDPFNPELRIINQSQGAESGTWYYGDGKQENFDPAFNPFHIYSPDTSRYTVKLVVFNSGGCSDSLSLPVCLNDSVYAIIPNAFSPDGNNKNEIFRPVVVGTNFYELTIYNRWGEKVFYSMDKNEGWDGSYKGGACQNGVYLYLLNYKGKKSILKQEKGTLLLIR